MTSHKVIRRRISLREFESIILDENAGKRKLTSILELKFSCKDGDYIVYVVKWGEDYHIFHGWSWFDGDKYGFYYEGAL